MNHWIINHWYLLQFWPWNTDLRVLVMNHWYLLWQLWHTYHFVKLLQIGYEYPMKEKKKWYVLHSNVFTFNFLGTIWWHVWLPLSLAWNRFVGGRHCLAFLLYKQRPVLLAAWTPESQFLSFSQLRKPSHTLHCCGVLRGSAGQCEQYAWILDDLWHPWWSQ